MTRQRRIFKVAASAAILMFSANAATPTLAQGDPPYCWQWAQEFCASIGAGGNAQCITYWNRQCEIEQGFARSGMDAVRPD
jgi:hypothetical protein